MTISIFYQKEILEDLEFLQKIVCYDLRRVLITYFIKQKEDLKLGIIMDIDLFIQNIREKRDFKEAYNNYVDGINDKLERSKAINKILIILKQKQGNKIKEIMMMTIFIFQIYLINHMVSF